MIGKLVDTVTNIVATFSKSMIYIKMLMEFMCAPYLVCLNGGCCARESVSNDQKIEVGQFTQQ